MKNLGVKATEAGLTNLNRRGKTPAPAIKRSLQRISAKGVNGARSLYSER